MVLAEGVFYQTSYDGTEVAIIANYPGLLPASQVSNQETPSLKGRSYYASPIALSRVSTGEAFDDTEEIGSCAGQAFEEEGR